MLVLSRNLNQTLLIGDNVKITVVGVNGNQVRFGIDAPRSIAVHREEVYKRIQKEKEMA